MLTKQEARAALAVTVDYPTLLRAPEFASSDGGEPAIIQDIRDEPDRVLRVMALAIHQIMLEVLTTEVRWCDVRLWCFTLWVLVVGGEITLVALTVEVGGCAARNLRC